MREWGRPWHATPERDHRANPKGVPPSERRRPAPHASTPPARLEAIARPRPAHRRVRLQIASQARPAGPERRTSLLARHADETRAQVGQQQQPPGKPRVEYEQPERTLDALVGRAPASPAQAGIGCAGWAAGASWRGPRRILTARIGLPPTPTDPHSAAPHRHDRTVQVRPAHASPFLFSAGDRRRRLNHQLGLGDPRAAAPPQQGFAGRPGRYGRTAPAPGSGASR